MYKQRNNEKAITLIALVVTIVVLLILAGVSISMLTGESGIISQAKNAKEQTEIGKEKEIINIAFTSVKGAKISRGDMSDVTSAELQEEINNYTKEATVTGTGILKITYTSGRQYEVDGNGNISNSGSYNGMYSVEGIEGKIAPQDLFEYEIIDEQNKTARIVRIKAEYCNLDGYNPHTQAYDLTNTSGDIIYKSEKISDMLVIPYEMEQNGVKYTITEANIKAEKYDYVGSAKGFWASYPNVDNLIYPNSIISINPPYGSSSYMYTKCGVKSIILSDNLKEIPEKAFCNGKNLTSITIPDSVTSIGSFAFYGCSSLTSITMPGSVTSIGNCAFYDCSSLTSITIPDSVTSIGNYAFQYCESLTSITIPDSVTSVGDRAFDGTAWYKDQPNGNLYIGKVYYEYNGSMPANTSIIIKDGTTKIADYAFNYCTNLTNITIPDSVTSIGYRAFYECENLTNITIPEGVTTIESMTFKECNKLTSVIVPESLTRIGNEAFKYCTSLTSITIPENVVNIGNNAFESCDNLTSITITNEDVTIGTEAFYECDGLKNIKITGSIGEEAFYGCDNLESVEVFGNLKDIGNSAFDSTAWLNNHPDGDVYINNIYYTYRGNMPENTIITIKDGTTMIVEEAFKNQTGLTSITIPEGVTSIENYTFQGCSNLKNITIPESVTSIEMYAFERCTGLTSITIPDSVTSIEMYAFSGCSSLITVNYTGTEEEWNKLYISYGNDNLENATVNYNYIGE